MKFAAFLLCLAFSVHAEMLTGYVVAIADGDTITVLDADHMQHIRQSTAMSSRSRSPSNLNSQGLNYPAQRPVYGEQVAGITASTRPQAEVQEAAP